MELNRYLELDTLVDETNICDLLDDDDIQKIGELVKRDYDTDEMSRSEWADRLATSLKLVQQLQEEKSFPWSGAANVKFPLLTISALQYHARAYPALVRGFKPVACRVIGQDPEGKFTARADRVANHMSFQLMEEAPGWEEGVDKALIVQSIIGCAFKKVYYDSGERCIVDELVLPQDLVLNYWTKAFDKAPRMTHVIGMSHEQLEERYRRGIFRRPVSDEREDSKDAMGTTPPRSPTPTILDNATDEITGMQAGSTDEDTPTFLLEQHRWLDLDGDGYREPYIAFVKQETGEMVRLVARFEKDKIERDESGVVLKIVPEQYFTQLLFIPSPDGGIYGMGFAMLLGSTNEVINSLSNQLLDAGTMSNLGGGFLARGVRVRGGDYAFRPQEWKRTDSTAEDLHKGVYQLPVKEPSSVLFQMLNLMLDWGSRIGMATDAATGQNPGQNQKVGTTEAVIAQGEKVFNGIYKRTYRAFRDEFRLIYRLNYLRKPISGQFKYADSEGKGGVAYWEDYLDTDKTVVPAADPSIASTEMLVQRAMGVRQLATSMPGYNRYEVEHRVLEALEVPEIDKILPKPGSPGAQQPSPPPAVQVAQIKAQTEQMKAQANAKRHSDELQQKARLNEANIIHLQAQAAQVMAETANEKNKGIIDLINTEISAARQYQEGLNSAIQGHAQILNNAQQMQQQDQPQDQPQPQGQQQQGAPNGGNQS